MNYKQSIKKYNPVNEQEKNDKKVILDYINHFEHNILTRENEIAHITSSALVFNKSMDKVIMIYHKIYDTWTWTGGHADGDTNLLEIAIKEAKEETGVKNIEPLSSNIISIDILPVWGHMKKGKYVSAHLHLNVAFALVADEKEELILNEEETNGVKWIDVEDFKKYSNEPYLIGIYEKIVRGVKR